MQQLLPKIAAKLKRLESEIEEAKAEEKEYFDSQNREMYVFQLDWRIGLQMEYNRIFKIYCDIENAQR